MKYKITLFRENIKSWFELDNLKDFRIKWRSRGLFFISNNKVEYCWDLSKFYSYEIKELK